MAEVMVHDILSYTAHSDAQAFGAWLVEVETAKAQEAAQRAAEAARAPAPVTAPQAPVAASGDCYSGTPVPAYIIDRESGGNPNAVNPSSGAYGCYQLMPMHFGSGGACAGLGTDLGGQKACAQRLYDAAGLSPWAL